MAALLFLLAFSGIALSANFNIPTRQFSLSPSLVRNGTLNPFSLDYGAGQFFINYARQYTNNIPGANTITFIPTGVEWTQNGSCTTIKQIGRVDGCAPPATAQAQFANMDAGGQLNPAWGFIFESAPAFGVSFPEFYDFLFTPTGPAGNRSTGLQFLQRILDARGANVQVIPVSGSPRQASGYLKVDAGRVGLAEICRSNYTWRFLPPSQQILDRACDLLVDGDKQINFVPSVVGLTVPGAVQARIVTAFEFAAAIDNYDARVGGFFPVDGYTGLCSQTNPQPQCTQNPGEAGLRYVHYPAWHQGFFISYIQINKGLWNQFSAAQKQALYDAGENALKDSWITTSKSECEYTRRILDINNGKVQLNIDGTPRDCNPDAPGVQTCSADMKIAMWRRSDLEVLQQARDDYLDSLSGAQDFDAVLSKYEDYENDIGFEWEPESFPRGCNGRGHAQDFRCPQSHHRDNGHRMNDFNDLFDDNNNNNHHNHHRRW